MALLGAPGIPAVDIYTVVKPPRMHHYLVDLLLGPLTSAEIADSTKRSHIRRRMKQSDNSKLGCPVKRRTYY